MQHLPLILSSTCCEVSSACSAHSRLLCPGVIRSLHTALETSARVAVLLRESALTCKSNNNERLPLHLRGREVKWLSHGFPKQWLCHYEVTMRHSFFRGWPQVQHHSSLEKVRLTWQSPANVPPSVIFCIKPVAYFCWSHNVCKRSLIYRWCHKKR